ncbi:chlororespiratory reduction protein 7 [filamentous cyanobacterium LEGE 11480]|uniref:Chlororespiratory reduction protein 7 n=1 Tax=Romeriopsis navalis LEGE 11480 TaxID=2777977 RepID=A0A928VKE8_9CYAN|nr:chlororespiratory reduction protein 7 [Romeriopsis navalis]MBE9029363.1 chlororespiratory reduction protein 7 [Romeriopsis navalis LEGE 11480]
MAASLYQEDYFVVLETNQPEQILTAAETIEKLTQVLLQQSGNLPPGLDLEQFDTAPQQAQHLIDTVCELPLGPEAYLQWYAVRIEK